MDLGKFFCRINLDTSGMKGRNTTAAGATTFFPPPKKVLCDAVFKLACAGLPLSLETLAELKHRFLENIPWENLDALLRRKITLT